MPNQPVRPLTDADWQTALALHRDHHWTFDAIGKLYGRTLKTVSAHLRALGAKRHSSPARRSIKGRLLHALWQTLRQRCNNPSYASYPHYGGRGIQTAPRKRGDEPLRMARQPVIVKGPVREIDWDRAVRLRRQGARNSEVAAQLGVSPATIHSGLAQRLGRTTKRRPVPIDRRRIHQLWESLKRRTTDPRDPLYPSNGGLGVRVCREWADFETFYRWATLTGSRPGMCLVRVRHRGPFSPGNCRWRTRNEAFAARSQRQR